jgi:hypothetical protein
MSNETPVVGTIGLKIWIDAGLDISGATLIQLRYNKPDGSAGNFSGTYEFRDPDHGAFYITTSATDIDQAGAWTFQLYVESGGNKFYGTKVKTEKFVEQLGT